jgi:hypothetical protein
MTTSRVYTKTAGEIIAEALRDSKIIAANQPITATDYQNGITSLNNLSKDWENDGLHQWLLKRAVLPLNTGQTVYGLGPDGDPCGYEDEFFSTELSVAAIALDTTVTVDSTEGMEAAPDILDADPTDSTQDWTALNSATLSIASGLLVTNVGATQGGAQYSLDVTPGETYRVRFSYTKGTSASGIFSVLNGASVADTVTLSVSGSSELEITAVNDTIVFQIQNSSSVAGQTSTVYDLNYVEEDTGSRFGLLLDDGTTFWSYVLYVNSATSVTIQDGVTSAAAIDNTVYSFVQQIERPLQLFNTTYLSSVGVGEIPVNRWSRQEYVQQPNKTAEGTVCNWYYNPYLEEGKLYVWQTANNNENLLKFDVRRPMMVYDNTADVLDFPSQYYMAIKWGIANDLGPSYGVKDNRQVILAANAANAFQKALDADNELDSIYVQPDWSGSR